MNTNSRWNTNYTLFGRPSIVSSTVLNFGGTYTHTHTRPHTPHTHHTHSTSYDVIHILFAHFLPFFITNTNTTYGVVGIGIAVDMFGRTIVDRLSGWLTKPYTTNNGQQDRI